MSPGFRLWGYSSAMKLMSRLGERPVGVFRPGPCRGVLRLAALILLAMSLPDLAAQVEYRVAPDSVFEVSSEVLGEGGLFHARPMVYILADNGRAVRAKVLDRPADFAGGRNAVRCQWRRIVAPGAYVLQVRPAGGEAPVEVTSSFQVMAPVIDTITPEWAVGGATVTVAGRYFGSRPRRLLLEIPGRRRTILRPVKPYAHPDERGNPGRSAMALETGASELTFVVPKGFGEPVPAMVVVAARLGSAEIPFYPDRYDLRDHGLVTPVKNQCGLRDDGVSDVGKSVGLCWAFAALAAFESSLLKQGHQTDPEADGANLSPWYLGNHIPYNGHPLKFNSDLWLDPVELEPPTAYGYIDLAQPGWGGGGGHWVCDYLNGGSSVVLWKDAPMPNEAMTRCEDLEAPAPLPSCGYLAQDMFLYEPDDFPSPEAFRLAIKKAVLEHGAIQSYVHLDGIDVAGIERQVVRDGGGAVVAEYVGQRFMDKVNHNYYFHEMDAPGGLIHAVCIVGWDNHRVIDIDGHVATGAWRVKDSNGTNTHDQGYYWVAFDDAVFLKSRDEVSCFAMGFRAHPGTGYRHPSRYQTHAGVLSRIGDGADAFYWYLQHESAAGYPLGMSTMACAQFTADGDEKLKAVGIVTMNRHEEVTVSVHRNQPFPPAPKARPIRTQTFRVEEKGYHLLDLRRPLRLADGDRLTVVVAFAHRPGNEHPLVYVADAEADMPTTHWQFSGATSWCDFPADSAFYLQAVMADD